MGRLRSISPAGWLVVGLIGVGLVFLILASRTQTGGAGAPSDRPSTLSGVGTGGPTTTPSAAPGSASIPYSPAVSSAVPASIEALLATLPERPERRDGYERSLFRHWIDADRDGCDTRREVLIIEAIVVASVGPSCTLVGGRWASAYDGGVFSDPAGLDVDHVVPLAEAWDSGAFAWTADRRMRYANDLDVPWALVAVSAGSNRSKGDKDPADWMPPAATFACTYVTWWIQIKARWSLSVDPVEHDALADVVSMCPDAPATFIPAPDQV